jgi:hypothetical protein
LAVQAQSTAWFTCTGSLRTSTVFGRDSRTRFGVRWCARDRSFDCASPSDQSVVRDKIEEAEAGDRRRFAWSWLRAALKQTCGRCGLLFTPRSSASKKRSSRPSRIAPTSPVSGYAGRPTKAGLRRFGETLYCRVASAAIRWIDRDVLDSQVLADIYRRTGIRRR